MIPNAAHMTEPTPLDHLARSLRARASVPSGQEPPAAILWADPGSQWRALLPAALRRIPELLVLGDFRPERRTGPAIWLRCVVDGTIDASTVPAEGAALRPPVIYLPGVERGQLRAGEDCPDEVRPLVELMYRGALWQHPKGRPWSAAAFLRSTGSSPGSPGGPGLDIATDQGTVTALLGALDQVALTPVEQLRGRRLGAPELNRLAGVDVMRDILRWMADPEGARAQMGDKGWPAFRAECRRELDFDPEIEADVSAGAGLGKGEGRWADVWKRFAEAPGAFPGVAEVLERSRPAGELRFDRERWPDLNDEDEQALRRELAALPGLPHGEACRTVTRLEREHAPRRGWVWAQSGRSPFAAVLKPLARLAKSVRAAIGGAAPGDIARVYTGGAWLADAAARETLASSPPGGEHIVAEAVRHLIEPWLGESARAFQSAVERRALPSAGGQPAVEAGDDECIVFVDGLRYELGRRLAERLGGRGYTTTVAHRWAAVPTVTATGKPAVTPVADDIAGDRLGADFRPVLRSTSRPVRADRLREAMEKTGYQIVGAETLEIPLNAGARGWLETGEIDRHGHHHGAVGFARQVDLELRRLVRRVARLLEAGWRSVRVVTDHGWLLLPGGLPMVTLPRHLTESKWARCAVISGGSAPDAPLYPWHWNPDERFASPPGIACFSTRDEYAHGGLSVQECLIPDIRVEGKADSGPAAAVQAVAWVRFRCNVTVRVRGGPASADLRLGGPAGKSVASSPKPIDADGFASLVLADDAYEDAALVLVVTDADGRVLAQRPTRRGEDL